MRGSSVWRAVGVVIEEDEILIDGVNPWQHRWVDQKESVELPHPAYPRQRHTLYLYKIEMDSRTIEFAAGELSPGVWGFYEPIVPSG